MLAVIWAATEGIPWELIGPVGAAMVLGWYGQYRFGTLPERKRADRYEERSNNQQDSRLEDAKLALPVLGKVVEYLDKVDEGASRRRSTGSR